MEDQVITSTTEPTIVESANTSAENTAGLSQVIDQATPMDSNTTYNNLPKVEYQPNMGPIQNIINEAVQTEHAINQETNAGKAMNNFLTQWYDYDKNEAGSYWVAGAINDNNTQMSFLQTLINEEMYDEMDLQKYYYDTNLATARAYAAQKSKETAYGFYRAAQERALAEGELTGWYMPAEGRYLLGQYTVAQNTLENPDATPEEISKANRVAKAAESWFSANQITTRGIKCLAMMNYEENVRHNTVMGELQKQANAIAAAGAAASSESAKLQLRELKFQLEEYELQSGHNITKEIGLDNDNTLGHDVEKDYKGLSALQGFKDTSIYSYKLDDQGNKILDADGNPIVEEQKINAFANLLRSSPSYYAAVLGATNTDYINDILTENGLDPKEVYDNYETAIDQANLKKSVTDNSNILNEEYLKKQTYTTTNNESVTKGYKDKHIYEFANRAYVKDNNGVYHQVTKDITLSDGTKLSEKIYNFNTSKLSYEGKEIQVGSIRNNTANSASVANNWKNYDRLTDGSNNDKKNSRAKTIEEYEAKGYVWQGNKRTAANWDIDAGTVMYNAEENKYISISDITNDVEEWDGDSKDIVEIDQPKWKVGSTFHEDGTGKYKYMVDNSMTVGEMTIKDNYGKDRTTTVYMYVDGSGTAHYYHLGEPGSKEVLTSTYTIISEEEALKVDPNITQKAQDLHNYRNGIVTVKTETKGGKNADTITQETAGKTKPKDPRDSSTKFTTPTISGGSKEFKSNNYSTQEIKAVYERVEVNPYDAPEIPDTINNLDDLEKWLEDYKSINNVIGGDQ